METESEETISAPRSPPLGSRGLLKSQQKFRVEMGRKRRTDVKMMEEAKKEQGRGEERKEGKSDQQQNLCDSPFIRL